MKNKLYALFLALAGTIAVSAQNEFGIWASAINLSTNGGSNAQFYNTTALAGDPNAIGSVNFSGNLGTFEIGSSLLVIKGAELKTWKGTNANVCGGKLNYRVFPKGAASGPFTQVNIGFKSDCSGGVFGDGLGACGDRDQKWSTTNANNIISIPATPGTYVLEIYYEISGQAGGTTLCNDTRYESGGGSNFSAEFTVTSVLPVRLLDFSGRKQTQGVSLSWNTASEENFRHFIVEHSQDGIHFNAVGTVLGKGNAAAKSDYQFWHRQPVQGANYYRLRQVDRDGSFAYSKVVNVDWSGKPLLSVYPNPTKDLLYVSGLQKGDQIQIIDFAGKVLQTLLSAGESMNVNVRSLPTGTYILRAGQKDQFASSTFVKE